MRTKNYLDNSKGSYLFVLLQYFVARAFNKIGLLTILFRSLYLPPSWIQIEPTTKCNLRCTICLRTRTSPDLSDDMNMDVFRSIIDQSVGSRLVKPIIKLIGLGEPLLNPQIASMVKYAKRKGLTVEMISNFTSANPKVFAKFVESQLDYLGVSLDSTSPQTFERIRVGARFGEVVDNVKLFLNIRKSLNSEKPRVFFRSTISQGNAEEIPTIAEFAKSINVDYVVFSNQIISKEESHKYSRFITPRHDKSHREAMSWFQKKTSVCHAMTGCYVTHDGKIMPCNFLMEIIPREKYPQFEFGVISRSSFSSIWFSKRYKQFRARKALGFHPHFCNSCPCIP